MNDPIRDVSLIEEILLLSGEKSIYAMVDVWRFLDGVVREPGALPHPSQFVTGRIFVDGSGVLAEVWDDEPQQFNPPEQPIFPPI
jgi:hypothetical protein